MADKQKPFDTQSAVERGVAVLNQLKLNPEEAEYAFRNFRVPLNAAMERWAEAAKEAARNGKKIRPIAVAATLAFALAAINDSGISEADDVPKVIGRIKLV